MTHFKRTGFLGRLVGHKIHADFTLHPNKRYLIGLLVQAHRAEDIDLKRTEETDLREPVTTFTRQVVDQPIH